MSQDCTANGVALTAKCFSQVSTRGLAEIKAYLLCQWASRRAVASDWAARVVANGGAQPSDETVAALTVFVEGLVTAGLDSKMIAVNCFAPDSLIAAITPLIVGPGNDPWTLHGFVAGDITTAGLKGDTNAQKQKYLETGCDPAQVFTSANDAGFSIYAKNDSGRLNFSMIGTDDTNYAGLYTDATSVNLGGFTAWDVIGGVPVNTGVYGFYSGNRTAVNACAVYEANSGIPFHTFASATGAPGTRPARPLFVFCWNKQSAPANFPANEQTCSFAAIHHGLTAAEAETFFDLVQALRTALGGGYV